MTTLFCALFKVIKTEVINNMKTKKHFDIVIFCLISFGTSWAVWFSVIAAQLAGILANGLIATALVALGMFGPILSVFVTKRIILKENSTGISWKLGIDAPSKAVYYVLALFAPLLVTAICALFYFAIFPQNFDASLSSTIATVPPDQIEMLGGNDAVYVIIIAQVLINGTIGAFVNIVPALGEEAGWRGFLYPQLINRFGITKGILLGGVIWGLWHLPLTVTGHNYGTVYFGYPVFGVLAMCLFCIASGICMAWLVYKTNSIWPAALCHGAMNAFAGGSILFLNSNSTNYLLLGPTIAGLISGVPLFILAAVIFIIWRKKILPNR